MGGTQVADPGGVKTAPMADHREALIAGLVKVVDVILEASKETEVQHPALVFTANVRVWFEGLDTSIMSNLSLDLTGNVAAQVAEASVRKVPEIVEDVENPEDIHNADTLNHVKAAPVATGDSTVTASAT